MELYPTIISKVEDKNGEITYVYDYNGYKGLQVLPRVKEDKTLLCFNPATREFFHLKINKKDWQPNSIIISTID